MAITPVQTKAASGNSGTAHVLTATSVTTAGNLLVMLVSVANNPGDVTFTPPTGWVQAGTTLHDDVFISESIAVYYYANNPGGLSSFTFTSSAAASAWHLYFLEFSGVATTSPLDGFTNREQTGTTPSSGAITTTANGDLIIGWSEIDEVSGASDTAITQPSGYTALTRLDDGGAWNSSFVGWTTQTTAGSINYAPTKSLSASEGVFTIVAFQAAAGGGTPVNGSATLLSLAGLLGGLGASSGTRAGVFGAGPGLGAGALAGINTLAGGLAGSTPATAMGAGGFGAGGLAAGASLAAASAATPSDTLAGSAGLGAGAAAGTARLSAQSAATPSDTLTGAAGLGAGAAGAQAGLPASSAATPSDTFSGTAGLGGGLAGAQAGLSATSAATPTLTLTGAGSFGANLMAGLAALAATGSIIGGALHGAATLLATAIFGSQTLTGNGMVFGSTASANSATVTGSADLQPGGLFAGIAAALAASAAAARGTLAGTASVGTPTLKGAASLPPAGSAATPALTLVGRGALSPGGLLAGMGSALATGGGILNLPPFRVTATVVRALLALAFHTTPVLSATTQVRPLLALAFQTEPPVAQPYSTIKVIATATDINGSPVTNMGTATCVVSFPDGTSASFSLAGGTIANLGAGQYSITYTTTSPGMVVEEWKFTDVTGNQTDYRHNTPVAY